MLASVIFVSCAPAPTPPTPPKDPYVVGLVGSLTGPMAISYLPIIDGIRIYLEQVNDRGGINGRKVKILLEDSKSSPTEAGVAARKLTELGIQLLVAPDGSPTYAAYTAEAKRANVPLIIGGVASPGCMPPTPDPLMYNAMWGSLIAHGQGVAFGLARWGGQGGKAGLLTVDAPAAKLAGNMMVEKGKEFGLEDVLYKTVPIGTLDMTPVAIAFKEFGVNVVTAYGVFGFSPALADALIKIGYEGKFWFLIADPVEYFLERYGGVDNMILSMIVPPFKEDLPIHKEIKAAASKFGVTELNSNVMFGWEEGMVIEAIFKKVGWPVTTDKLVEVMENFELKRPFMGSLKWTEEDHSGPLTLRDHVWDKSKGDWVYKPPMIWANSYGVKEVTEIP